MTDRHLDRTLSLRPALDLLPSDRDSTDPFERWRREREEPSKVKAYRQTNEQRADAIARLLAEPGALRRIIDAQGK